MANKSVLYILALCSIAVGVYSSVELYGKIKMHLYGDTLEINPAPVDIKTDKETLEQNIQNSKEPAETQLIEEKLPPTAAKQEETQEIKQKASKVSFEYKNKKAKKVSIAGSFSKWKELPMKKNGEIWKAEVYMFPGNYFFHYMVDGKKTLDAKAPKTPMGESLVSVK